jgi:hypothetical protein
MDRPLRLIVLGQTLQEARQLATAAIASSAQEGGPECASRSFSIKRNAGL